MKMGGEKLNPMIGQDLTSNCEEFKSDELTGGREGLDFYSSCEGGP